MVSSNEQKALWYAEMMNCATGQWPIKYLGVSVSGNKLHVKDWLFLDEKLSKRLDGWQGASLSYGGRLTLINACLSSIPTYAMSMYLLPKTIIKKMDRTRKRFFWQGGSIKKKYHLVKWMVVTRPKKRGVWE
jgi:mannosylglycoprotein endo-beta-mannosidase